MCGKVKLGLCVNLLKAVFFVSSASGFPCLRCANVNVRSRKHDVRLPAAATYVDVRKRKHDVMLT